MEAIISVLTSAGVTVIGLWAAGRFLGERLFGHWLEGRLQRQKEAHDIELAKFKSEQDARLQFQKEAHEVELEKLRDEQNQKIEALRADLTHLLDRGKLSNEREYSALAEIWEQFVSLYYETRRAVVAFIQYPDLEKMQVDRVSAFLETTDLSKEQKTAVMEAEKKNDKFSYFVRLNNIVKAQHSYFDFGLLLDKRGIFIPSPLKGLFEQTAELANAAIAQLYTEVGGPRVTGMTHDLDFRQRGPAAFEALKDEVRGRLLYEVR
jgi:hypothetical protein